MCCSLIYRRNLSGRLRICSFGFGCLSLAAPSYPNGVGIVALKCPHIPFYDWRCVVWGVWYTVVFVCFHHHCVVLNYSWNA